jgi:hypothetical protein
MYGVIGTLDWQDCDTCMHSDSEMGGCDIDDVVWECSITVEDEQVCCGCYAEEK